jgi:polar amino acid transport system permease protein
METGLDFHVIANNFTSFMIGRYPDGPLGGVALTLILAFYSVSLSVVGGLILGLLSVSKRAYIRLPVMAVIQVLRGVPLLMVIFWMYFLMPALFGQGFPENTTVVVALTVFTSAYMSQIVRAGIESIPKGLTEAGLSSGLSQGQVMRFIVLPQALRNMIPSFVNQFVSLIKDTSLAFIVGVSELTHVATQVNNRTLNYPTEIFLFIAAVYFVICFAFTSFSRWVERFTGRVAR